jgi:peptide/nickel transport system substrate-binding protein
MSKFGFTPVGNEKKAIQDITNAIARAAWLPENQGRLVKGGKFWRFDGEDVMVRFMIRADDPNGRLREGRYIAAQIEKAGIRVERLEWDRKKCAALSYNGDPARLEWQLYTEAWGPAETRLYWDDVVSQMYAPWQGYQAGGANPDHWNYENPDIDALTQKVAKGLYTGEKEYWDSILKAAELGIAAATRIFIVYQTEYFAANTTRFNQRMIYGLGEGLNTWSLVTADVKPEASGEKILRVTEFSARGSPFQSAWDPVGIDGFADPYSVSLSAPCAELSTFRSPGSGVFTPWRASWRDVETRISLGKDAKGSPTIEGRIPVPENAVIYDSRNKKWARVAPTVVSFSKATYSYKWGAWHTGIPIGIADVMYAQAFIGEWTSRDGDGDRYYDAGYESAWRPRRNACKGLVVNPEDSSITAYFDYNHMDKDAVAGFSPPDTYLSASGAQVNVSWEIIEALAKMVAEGGKSGTAWSFSAESAFTEVDLLNLRCLQDIKAKLREFIDAKYVPAPIVGFTTAKECVARYQAAIDFIDAHDNAYIGNGPFFISAVDLYSGTVELAANRDQSYPFVAGRWNAQFSATTTRIDGVGVTAVASKGKPVAVSVRLSFVSYPSGTVKPVDSSAKVTLTLVTPLGEKAYKASYARLGLYSATIPAEDTRALAPGTYTIVASSQLKDEAPSMEAAALTLH